jgi:hypothetical protein
LREPVCEIQEFGTLNVAKTTFQKGNIAAKAINGLIPLVIEDSIGIAFLRRKMPIQEVEAVRH